MEKRNNGDLLAVIDMQRVYLPEGAWATPGILRAEQNILALLQKYEDVIFTRHLSAENPVGTWARYNAAALEVDKNPNNARLIESLAAYEGESLEKTTYSAFGSPDFSCRAQAAKRLILTGVQSEFCVLATLLDAVDAGIDVIYVADAVAGSATHLERAVEDIVRLMPAQAALMATRELLED